MKMSQSLSIGDLSFKYLSYTRPALGLIVSRKYGNAVVRNLFKRRCRGLFRTCMINRGLSIALIVRPNKKNLSFTEIQLAFTYVYDQVFDK